MAEDVVERKGGRGGLEVDEGLGRSTSSLRRSASGSALDYGRPSSSLSSRSTSSHKAKKKGHASESESSSEDDRHRRGSRGKGKKTSRKGSAKAKSKSESSESESSESSESSSSSCSTVSYRSSGSVKKGPFRRGEAPQEDGTDGPDPERPPSKKDDKKKKKKVDSLVMKYLYKPDSD